jgi:hypothetical protein
MKRKVTTIAGENSEVISWSVSGELTDLIDNELQYCSTYNKIPLMIIIVEEKT